jgi:3-phosphoshikimate 1-carboxyvinyltransferase
MALLSDSVGSCPIPSGLRLEGRVQVPPSKSLTQRFLNLALLSRKSVTLDRPLLSEDTRLFLTGLRRLGSSIEERAESVTIEPGEPVAEQRISCGNNGTMFRFLTASLTAVPGRWLLDGSDRLRQRPVGPLVEALGELGAEIEFEGRAGYAPLRIAGGSLAGGRAELDARLSSQFASALLMAATAARRQVEVHLRGLSSAPYLDLTLATMRCFGARPVRLGPRAWRVVDTELQGGRWAVEGDFSAAAYPAAAAAVTGGTVRISGISADSMQGDRRFLEVLGAMGVGLSWLEDGLQVVGGGPLAAVDVDLSDLPDQVPTLAAIAPFAVGTTIIRNVPHLRLKESDRLAAMATELRRLGAEVDELPDGLIIRGAWAEDVVPAGEVSVQTYGDHRIAMSLAICGLRRPGVIVLQPEVVAKSYPDFWRDLEGLLH